MQDKTNKRKAAAALREIIAAARKYVEAEQAIVQDLKGEEPALEHRPIVPRSGERKENASR